jgi:tRNA (guanine-N7-)-methyltransferase
VGRVRVRQHVNPLSKAYQTPVTPPDWSEIYTDITKPLHLDIGSAGGGFLLEMAQLEPDWNYLGLEIRQPLVERSLSLRDEKELQNLHYIFCNVNNSFKPLVDSLPKGVLTRISIQFPDPWFKKRHQKRRVVTPEFVEELANEIESGVEIFLQSDVYEVEVEMRDRFAEHPAFFQPHGEQWLSNNLFPVATEREQSVLEKGDPVYRTIFRKR